MSTNPINSIGSKPTAPLSNTEDTAPNTAATPAKPAIKPPLERPFSLSLPPESTKPATDAIVNNINESNKETERLTKKSAEESKLQELVLEQQTQDQLLNGPGKNGV